MPAPRFVTSDTFGAPGVYIRERTPAPIVRGIQNNVVGIAGVCVRGPVDRGVVVTSEARFKEVFGARDYGAGGAFIGEVWKFLLNKPFGRLVVIRAAAAAAVKASFTLETAAGGAGTAVLRIDASSPGVWGNDVQFKVSAASNGVSTSFNLTLKYLGKVVTYQNLSITGTEDNTLTVLGDDDANLVTLTKLAGGRPVNNAAATDGGDALGFVNLGETVVDFVSVAGAEGAIADTDFTAANRALSVLANYKGIGIAAVAGRSNSVIKAAILAKAAANNDRLFLVCPDASNTAQATAITELGTLRDDRVVYCFNYPTTLDPDTATTITVEPHAWMAAILSQTDADVHPGVIDTKAMLAGITGLTFENLEAGDYDLLDEAGINALERHAQGGFLFVSGVTTDLTDNNAQIDGRRTKDFLISGIANRLEDDVKKPNTKTRRIRSRAAVVGFATDLAKQERFVAQLPGSTAPAIDIRNDESVNSPGDIAIGIQRMLARIQTIPQGLVLVLDIEVGTTVQITEQAA